MPTSTTKPSTRKLSDAARHVVAPKGVVSTGWPAVEVKSRELGIRFRWWQKPIGQIILSKRSNGKYAATVGGTGLSIPRQVGKTFLVGAIIFALCLLRPGLTVIWTAHRVRTAEETFKKMQAFTKRSKIAPHILKVILGSGEESIEFRNGSRILFGARATGFGRGFDEVDVLIFDEAQILTEAALDDMIPATNQSRQETSALLLFMGTPPRPQDPGEVFTRMRDEALSGEDDDTGWIEFGADPDHQPTPLPAPLSDGDWAQIERANPSFPDDTPREAILRMRKKLGADSFKREGYGIWDERVRTEAVIAAGDWVRLESDGVPDGIAPTALAVDQWYDGTTAIGAAWRVDEGWHTEVLALDHVHDNAAVVDLLVKWAGKKITVAVAGDSPAAAMVGDLRARGVKVNALSVGDLGKACVGLHGDVMQRRVTHKQETQLDEAVAGAKKAAIGTSGLWRWDRRNPEINLTPLMVITLARFAASVTKHKDRTGQSVFR